MLKIGSAQIGAKDFQNHEITGKHSMCSKQLKLKGMSFLNVESYVFMNLFCLVLNCIHVCVDDVIKKKADGK